MRQQGLAIFLLFLATFISAIAFFFVKKTLLILPPANLMFWRYLIATIALIPFSRLKTGMLRPGLLLGVVLFGNIAFQYIALLTMPASTTSFVMGFAVVLVPLFARVMNLQTWTAAVIAMLGIGILSLHSGFSIGLGYVLLGAICFAVYIIFVSKYTHAHSMTTLNCIQCAVMCLLSALLVWLQGVFSIPQDGVTWLYIAILAIVNSAIAIQFQLYAQRHLSHTTTAIIVSCEPIFATLVATTLLSESLTGSFYLGALFMLISIVISEMKINKPKAPEC